jgi:hypothetical protein
MSQPSTIHRGIRPYDNLMRFLVPSQTRVGIDHVVDLAAFGGAGGCSCEHFSYRCAPELRKGAKPSTLLRCNHIELARDHFLSGMVDKIMPHCAQQDDGCEVPPQKVVHGRF